MSLIQQLGFLEFEVSDLPAWEGFMTKVLGTQLVDKAEDGTMRFRMDGHAYRFVVTPGPRDDLRTMGWQVESAQKLDECVARLEKAGVEVTRGDADACAAGAAKTAARIVNTASRELPSCRYVMAGTRSS